MLQDVSDSSQDKAILVLMQLQQRIITSGPIENLRPPPLFANPRSLEEKPPLQPRQITGRSEKPNGHVSREPSHTTAYPCLSPYEDVNRFHQ